ncbi:MULTISPECIES: XkdX family protein [Staphylococcus]|uniref:XkdX family protein n=1 Tax=Staphylococcus agnetis TaxID=985762 RepID=A0AAW9YZR0_9STAP|nr:MULTISPECIES: XkdX family protein [Staphylococcus]NHM75422.1 XkdX family protein [Staphylococcus sp. 11007852]NHM93516.1 XkdX family protein [Staphylococcus sp. 10602379]NJH83303.1 XkdX family protein [Staphylococcus agnetis]NJI03585.1 XkdX family protein [Staphylococcus agnetis]NJI14332.1 XkdX family protein [Staphylococcus agnetis]
MSVEGLKYLYDENLYTNDQFKIFVVCKWITAEEYKTITGVEYQVL